MGRGGNEWGRDGGRKSRYSVSDEFQYIIACCLLFLNAPSTSAVISLLSIIC